MTSGFDDYAGNYDSALNEGLSRSGESREYFAHGRVMRRIPFDRDAKLLSPPHARALLARAGFEVLGTDFLFLVPRELSALRPLEARLARFPTGAQHMVLCRKSHSKW